MRRNKKMKSVEEICKLCPYARKKPNKYQGIKDWYDCSAKEGITCFEPKKFNNCFYYEQKETLNGWNKVQDEFKVKNENKKHKTSS